MVQNSSIDKDALIEVLTAEGAPKSFTYAAPLDVTLRRGQLVRVPLGKKFSFGVVLGPSQEVIPPEKLKTIASLVEAPPLQPALIDFIFWVADYCMSLPGNILAMAIGGHGLLKPLKRKPKETPALTNELAPKQDEVHLSPGQAEAAKKLRADVKAAQNTVTLLDGVTGSGKTEVYCEAIAQSLEAGKQALLLLPEIALTTQIYERIRVRFGFAPALWHSNLTPAQRRNTWFGVAEGKIPLVIGARSALFLPFAKLGVIIVDEEHDSSYKQEEGVIYNARDMAVVRGKLENIPVILSSATPSLETVVNVKAGRYTHLHLPERHAKALLPDIHLVDLKLEKLKSTQWISPTLQNAIKTTLERGEQSLLFLNRRGFAPLTLCRACGYRFQCPQCSAWLVEHRSEGTHRLACHHCDYKTLYPEACPSCGVKDKLAACGPGIERLQQETAKLFPNAKVATLASDTLTNMKQVHEIVADMQRGAIDILIGTQIIAKGYHFPKLTLVGVVDGDLGLQGGDLRAGERTFQLLYQVAGRSGREQIAGHVYIQTTQPKHPVMQSLALHDRDKLVDTLMQERKTFHMPPFARLATITLSGAHIAEVKTAVQKLAQHIPVHDNIRVLGPSPAPMAFLRGKHRMRFLLQAPKQEKMQEFIHHWLHSQKLPHAIRLHIDIDPQNFV
jgi:primosomal protein N' (replication factor Y)